MERVALVERSKRMAGSWVVARTALGGVLLLAGCASEPEPAPAAPALEHVGPEDGGSAGDEGSAGVEHAAAGPGGGYAIRWRPSAGAVPVNRHFGIDVRLFGDAAESLPLAGADLRVSAWMPDHAHGMLVRPRVADLGDGRYRVDGVLLHMHGRWQLFFDVIDRRGLRERTTFELDL